MTATNFAFLKYHDPIFFQLATTAEKIFAHDPNTTLVKLRQLGEAMAQDIAARVGIDHTDMNQLSLINQLVRRIGLDDNIRALFHTLRVEGNKATHQFKTSHKQAMDGIKVARALAVWFHRSFGPQGASFTPGSFVMPDDPSEQLREYSTEIEQLKASLQDANQQIESSQELLALKQQEADAHARLAAKMDEEAKTYAELAEEQEAKLETAQQEFNEHLKDLQFSQQDVKVASKTAREVKQQTAKATAKLQLNEELTRILIDTQLLEAGWEADTQTLTYANGARPEKGKNKAIAEWPTTGNQKADYVLFMGCTAMAVVEAKRKNKNVAGAIPQAERYSKGFRLLSEEQLGAWLLQNMRAPWLTGDGTGKTTFKIPFVYSCNGRPYIKQLAEQSGTWFRDCRKPSNTARALADFHTPQGLLDMLTRDKDDAGQKLREESFDYLGLRDYQQKAVQAVEVVLENDQRKCLLAMATGTGKTRTIIGLMYRFLKAERFKRILFLVDRTSLGDQATDSFREARLEQNQTLAQIYDIKELGEMAPEAETRVQVATVQAMVKRIFQNDNPIAVDQFDCIIVDEAHRGYTLDQEMGEGEMEVRDAGQYLSSYRRVLDHFDAVKIGLTATPAKHTAEIFGKPVYTYSYREAVADDWLIDHEPPIRYKTLLSEQGIHFEKGEEVTAIDTRTGEIDTSELEDDLDFNVEQFNRRVISENFNRVICEQLAQELDPFGDEKTMIFCATDNHADMVKRLLDDAFKAIHGDDYNEAAVRKITGQSDKVPQLIKHYKNERYPNVAITVDLLTTGIDVPKICNLVFMRRVRSRILYEQMLGRATRRCDEIGKTVFRVYDPVDIYAALQSVSTMKPVVKNPDITMGQLIEEVCSPEAQQVQGSSEERSHSDDALDALSQKVMRVMRKAKTKAERNPALQEKLEQLEEQWGVPPEKLHQHLHESGVRQAAEFLQTHSNLVQQLDDVKAMIGSEYRPVISEHEDEFTVREQSYGEYQKPEDYLDSFSHFVNEQINESAALSAVVNRPKELTREQLKEVKMLLDSKGYSEVKLDTAWRNQTNQDIAASIIGHVRRAALGEAMIPFEQRVDKTMEAINALHPWTTAQRKWLDRLAKQVKKEVVIDSNFVNRVFATQGGAKRFDNVLGGKLGNVMELLSSNLWSSVG